MIGLCNTQGTNSSTGFFMSSAGETIDPITLEVIQESMISIVREMRANLIATAYSSVIHEAHDFSCVLVDAKGEIVAMAEDNPSHIFPVPWSVRAMKERFGDDIHPGDVFLHNDPYTGGTHLNDIAMVYPVFVDGTLALFPVVRAHWSDVGGTTPGSISGKNTEILHDGVRIPVLKVASRGKLDESVLDLLVANMRLPRERRGDFLSTWGTCQVAERRIQELATRYGLQTMQGAITRLLDRADRRMRRRIADLPDGDYVYEHYLDPARVDTEPVRVRVSLKIKKDRMFIDFAGSSPQTPTSFNSGAAVATTGAFIVLKAFLDPGEPINHGNFRAIEMKVPEGCFLNARYPASCAGASEVRNAATSAMLGVMDQVMPEMMAGDIKGTANHVYIGGTKRDGEGFIFYEYPAAGTGGSPEADGSNALRNFSEGDFSSIQPAEAIEQDTPLLVERCEVRTDSAGGGLSRGGYGMRRDIRLMADAGVLSISSNKNVLPPFGVNGGYPGASNDFFVIRNGKEVAPSETPGKVSGFPLRRNDVVSIRTSGGGGWGDALDRDPRKVAADVQEGYLTPYLAKEMFGVVIKNGKVSDAQTKALRKALRKKQPRLVLKTFPEPDTPERRYCELSPAVMKRLGVKDGAALEMETPHGPVLRVWAKGKRDVGADHVRVGALAAAILRVRPGERVAVRRLRETGQHASPGK
jgi:N-methylhydantoinase B